MKKQIITGLIFASAVASATVPVVPDKPLDWTVGYSAPVFNTTSGDIEAGEYAYSPSGNFIAYRLQNDQDTNNFLATSTEENSLDLKSMREVQIVGQTYYFEYTDGKKKVREEVVKKDFDDVSKVKDFPQPKKKIKETLLEKLLPDAQAITSFDAASNGTFGFSNSISWSHTNNGNVLLVTVVTNTDTPPAVTYNSVAMTELQTPIRIPSDFAVSGWYSLTPSTGANTVAVTSVNTDVSGCSASYVGSSVLDTAYATSTAAVTTTFDATLTPTKDNSWVIETTSNPGKASSAGTATSLRCQEATLALATIADNNAAVTPPAATTLQLTIVDARHWATVIAAFAPPAVLTPLERLLIKDGATIINNGATTIK